KILAASPGHPGALMIMADIKAAAKDTVASIAILKEVLAADPRNREASYDLADWYKATGNPAATVQYEYTYNLDTTDVNPLFEIGEHYEQLKQTQKAIDAYVFCMRKDRDFTPAYIQLGKIYLSQGDNAKALRHFNLAIQTAPNSAEAYYYKGLCFSKMAQRDSAVVALNQALVFDRGMKEAAEELKKLKK
ncbi:MAG: tetratricopeptide repeat protein, partial [Sphingobacteriales bacterium]